MSRISYVPSPKFKQSSSTASAAERLPPGFRRTKSLSSGGERSAAQLGAREVPSSRRISSRMGHNGPHGSPSEKAIALLTQSASREGFFISTKMVNDSPSATLWRSRLASIVGPPVAHPAEAPTKAAARAANHGAAFTIGCPGLFEKPCRRQSNFPCVEPSLRVFEGDTGRTFKRRFPQPQRLPGFLERTLAPSAQLLFSTAG
jgi:hypothetical protein